MIITKNYYQVSISDEEKWNTELIEWLKMHVGIHSEMVRMADGYIFYVPQYIFNEASKKFNLKLNSGSLVTRIRG